MIVSPLDRNNDGHIEARELKQVFQILGVPATSSSVQSLLKEVDDDDNGKVQPPRALSSLV